jgi:hypothetical protein
VGIDKELTLINERMTWLAISESFIFSAFTTAVSLRNASKVIELLVGVLPMIGFLLAFFVYPAIFSANNVANILKAQRRRFELRLPEHLRIDGIASRQAHFFGNLPAFAIPAMMIIVWTSVILHLRFF